MNRIYCTALLIIMAISFSLGQKKKQTSEFNSIKKKIETLNIIPAFIDIKAIDINKSIINDTVFAMESKDSISSKIYNLLSKKYSIHLLDTNINMTNDIVSELSKLFYELDEADKSITNIEVHELIVGLVQNEESRYCVINFYGGTYKTLARIKQEEKELLSTAIAVAVLTLGSAYVYPTNGFYSIMRTIVFDKIDRKVIFYKYSSIQGANPKSHDTINQYIYKNYKSLYYK